MPCIFMEQIDYGKFFHVYLDFAVHTFCGRYLKRLLNIVDIYLSLNFVTNGVVNPKWGVKERRFMKYTFDAP